MTDDSLSEFDPLNSLAEEFLTRHRRGERPAVSEYTTRYPDLAERIRDLFPALLLVEEVGPRTHESTAPTKPMALLQLGEYRLVREIGRGGMGIVYEAVQESLGRRVAVKVLAPSLRHGQFLERFRREAKSAARLHHTNIVPVFGVGEHDGQPYYVMQFIDGRGLDAILADRKTPPDPSAPTMAAPNPPAVPTASFVSSSGPAEPTAEVRPAPVAHQPDAAYIQRMAQLALQAAEGLAYAHAQGVLHRDIKPANLLLDAQGILWIADFGLAKADDSDNLTEQGGVVGTLRYLAPERFLGQCDPRADIYALGVTLYEMLTLQPAFGAHDRAGLFEQIARRAVTPPRRLVAAIPLDLETIVLKAMAHEPGDRYATVEAMAEDLRRFLADRPILARRSSVLERFRRWRRRNPMVAWLTSAVVVLTLLLALGSTLASMWLLHALSESETARKEQREQLWRSLIDQARANRRSRRIGQRLESLRLLKEAADIRITAEIRNEVIACLALIDSEEVAHWPRPKNLDAGHYDIDFLHGRYAQYDETGVVRIRQLSDDAEILRIDSRGELFPWGLAFSPDGHYLNQQVQTNGRNLVWDVAGPPAKLVFDDFIGRSSGRWHRFSDDQRRLAVFRADGSVIAYDLAARRRFKELPPGSTSGPFAWHPHHPWLAFAKEKDLRVVNVENGKELARMTSPAPLDHLAWHPDGERLAASAEDHTIFLWKPMTAVPLLSFQGHKNFGINLSFHPSGNVLVSNDWDGRGRWWDAASGRQLLSAAGTFDRWLPGQPPVLSEDGNEPRLHRLVEQRVLRTLACQKDWRRARLHSARLDAAKRWLMVDTWRDLALFDLAQPTASLAALLPGRLDPIGFDSRGALLVGSEKDLTRRSLIEDGEGHVRLGPAEPLYQIARGEGWSSTADGRIAAVGCFHQGTLLFHHDRPAKPLRLGPQGDVRRAAVSSNARWVATATWSDEITPLAAVKIWDSASGRLIADLPARSAIQLGFSPDSRWLAFSNEYRCRVWRTGIWEETFAVDGKHFAFSSDGVLAVGNGDSIRLLDVDSGAEFARLEVPQETSPIPQCFSEDGTLLVTIGLESDTLMIWDLRALREELAVRGLDWQRPPYPPAKLAFDPANRPR